MKQNGWDLETYLFSAAKKKAMPADFTQDLLLKEQAFVSGLNISRL